MNPSGLLSALHKYRARENSDPTENFVTEAFAWLLKTESAFSSYFLMSLKSKHSDNKVEFEHVDWDTQCNWNNKFPDMVCTIRGTDSNFIYVFEHKVWSHLHDNQLRNYREYADQHYRGGYKLILITAHRGQHHQEPDEALRWSDVYTLIVEYLDMTGSSLVLNKSTSIRFLFEDFLRLLEDIGVAPLKSFTREEIVGYSTDFRYRINRFWEDVTVSLREIFFEEFRSEFESIVGQHDFRIEKDPDQWGRIGLSLFREWRPGLFAGVLLDPGDHGVGYSDPEKGPDVCLILSVEMSVWEWYKSPTYETLLSSLESIFEKEPGGWKLYDQRGEALSSDNEPNHWHPLHIRKPFVDLLSTGASSSTEEAAARVAEKLIEPLQLILFESAFAEVRSTESIFNNLKPSPVQLCHRLVAELEQDTKITSSEVFPYRSHWYLSISVQGNSRVLGFNACFDNLRPELYFFADPAAKPEELKNLLEKRSSPYPIDIIGNHPAWRLDEENGSDPDRAQALVREAVRFIS